MIEDVEVWSFYTYPPTRNKVGEREEGRGELGSLGITLSTEGKFLNASTARSRQKFIKKYIHNNKLLDRSEKTFNI